MWHLHSELTRLKKEFRSFSPIYQIWGGFFPRPRREKKQIFFLQRHFLTRRREGVCLVHNYHLSPLEQPVFYLPSFINNVSSNNACKEHSGLHCIPSNIKMPFEYSNLSILFMREIVPLFYFPRKVRPIYLLFLPFCYAFLSKKPRWKSLQSN